MQTLNHEQANHVVCATLLLYSAYIRHAIHTRGLAGRRFHSGLGGRSIASMHASSSCSVDSSIIMVPKLHNAPGSTPDHT